MSQLVAKRVFAEKLECNLPLMPHSGLLVNQPVEVFLRSLVQKYLPNVVFDIKKNRESFASSSKCFKALNGLQQPFVVRNGKDELETIWWGLTDSFNFNPQFPNQKHRIFSTNSYRLLDRLVGKDDLDWSDDEGFSMADDYEELKTHYDVHYEELDGLTIPFGEDHYLVFNPHRANEACGFRLDLHKEHSPFDHCILLRQRTPDCPVKDDFAVIPGSTRHTVSELNLCLMDRKQFEARQDLKYRPRKYDTLEPYVLVIRLWKKHFICIIDEMTYHLLTKFLGATAFSGLGFHARVDYKFIPERFLRSLLRKVAYVDDGHLSYSANQPSNLPETQIYGEPVELQGA